MTKADKEGQRKAPILRFKGFTDDWEQRKLGRISYIKGRIGWKSLKQSEYVEKGPALIASKHISNGKINWTSVDHIPDWRYEESPEIMLELNDIIFSKDGSIGNPAVITLLPNKATINSTMMLVRLDKNILSAGFFYQILVSNQFKKLVFEKTSGSSIPHIFQNDMKKFKFYFPQQGEQIKISNMLNILDNLIALYERKLKLLSQVKKYFLDNLFTEKEYPNLRFKGFTDAWEQRKLENLSEHKSGTSIEKYFSSDGLYKVISIGSYGLNNEYIDQGIRAVKNKTTESKLVRSGQLTMVLNDKTANGNLIGRCLLISTDNEFIVNQRTEIIIPGPDLNGNYAYYYLNGPFRSKVKRIAQGGTQIYVNYSSVKKQKINYPIKDEQIKISKLLKIIKKLITLYESKKQNLNKIKNTLLNTMFI